jgi:hypothetical protein
MSEIFILDNKTPKKALALTIAKELNIELDEKDINLIHNFYDSLQKKRKIKVKCEKHGNYLHVMKNEENIEIAYCLQCLIKPYMKNQNKDYIFMGLLVWSIAVALIFLLTLFTS